MAQGTKSGGVITLRRHINCGNPGHTEVLTTLITQWPRTWWSSLIGLVTVKNLPATSDTTRRLRRTEMSGRGLSPLWSSLGQLLGCSDRFLDHGDCV